MSNTYYLQYSIETYNVQGISNLRTFKGVLPEGLVKVSDITENVTQFVTNDRNLIKYFNPLNNTLYDNYDKNTGEFYDNE